MGRRPNEAPTESDARPDLDARPALPRRPRPRRGAGASLGADQLAHLGVHDPLAAVPDRLRRHAARGDGAPESQRDRALRVCRASRLAAPPARRARRRRLIGRPPEIPASRPITARRGGKGPYCLGTPAVAAPPPCCGESVSRLNTGAAQSTEALGGIPSSRRAAPAGGAAAPLAPARQGPEQAGAALAQPAAAAHAAPSSRTRGRSPGASDSAASIASARLGGRRRSERTGGGGPSPRPASGSCRVAAAKRTQPRPKTSVASVKTPPRTCSGER